MGLAVTFTVALATALLLTPLVRWLARRLEIVDRPDEHRKLHARPTPLAGGVAVLGAFLAAMAVVLSFSHSQRAEFDRDTTTLAGIVCSALVICCVGLMDDTFGLRGRQKLFGQVLAASILLASGTLIESVQVFGVTLDLGLLAVPFTMFWVLGAMNSLNLIDGLDGLATSVGIILSLAVAVLATLTGNHTEAFMALALAGALVGFLVYNSPPASIFLGDTGSLLIGLLLGALAIRASLKGPATAVLAAPTAIWAVPIIDSAMALLRRRLTGRTIYTTDRGHLHHTLLQRGMGNRRTVAFIGLLCTVTAVGATLSVLRHNELLAYGAAAAVFATLVVTRVFGHNECLLLARRLKGLVISLAPTFRQAQRPHEVQARFRGDKQWEELWKTLTQFADRFDLSEIHLNVNLPAIGEEFHASWSRKVRPAETDVWHSDIPLVARNMTAGRLRITGARNEGSVCAWMGDLIAGLKPFETQMQDMLEDATVGETATGGESATGGELQARRVKSGR